MWSALFVPSIPLSASFSAACGRSSCTRSRPPPQCTLLTPRPQSSAPVLPETTVPPPAQLQSHPLPDHPDWRYIGPPLSDGPLPSILYLALTADQSLTLDPFNQLVPPLLSHSVRVFSVTLPFHSTMSANELAFEQWAQTYSSGGDPVSNFVRRVSHTINSLVDQNLIPANSLAIAGLSRGGLLAAMIAARNQHVKACLGFAPVTVLKELPEFADLQGRALEKLNKASLLNEDVLNGLTRLSLRFYMGNFDRRVGTRGAFEVVCRLAEKAGEEGIRSPPYEFIMYCSVGKEGHGTPPDVFLAGAEYLLAQVL